MSASEAFADRMAGILNDSCLALLIGVGHQTGLFDAMAALPGAGCAEIAGAAGLQEELVREWLGGMVAGGIVRHDPDEGGYTLPPDHAACLTRAAGPGNLAGLARYPAAMGEVEQQLVAAFRTGDGAARPAGRRLSELRAEESGRIADGALVSGVLPLVPGLPGRLREGIEVLDVHCGRGRAVAVLARAFPASRFRGLDLREEDIAAAREEAARLGLANTTFDVADSADLDGHYDLITAFDALGDLADPARTLLAVRDALHDDGVFLTGDLVAGRREEEGGDPAGPLPYGLALFHGRAVFCAEASPSGRTMRRMLTDAGFTRVDCGRAEGDPLTLYCAARKS
ncbi:class I SAM-dependent methyltransferase [Peterkaempfera griseoplana]|uniref:class I SAM-dependent methyltransferase n=1 Tax=Peterkaempfera griseoplana TaxID=66896 RepID=UPI0006E120B0|nr:methyltransferase domain-containing protein [Peterkaempfera griseoplana]